MGSIYEKNGAFHWRCYSNVNVKTGEPLPANGNGKVLRTLQSVMLVRKDEGLHRTKGSPAVLTLASQKAEEIESWKHAANHCTLRRRTCHQNVKLPLRNGELREAAFKADWQFREDPHDRFRETVQSGKVNGDFPVERALVVGTASLTRHGLLRRFKFRLIFYSGRGRRCDEHHGTTLAKMLVLRLPRLSLS